jgi:hypothetical protein
MEEAGTPMPSKVSGWLGKLTAKPPKSEKRDAALPEATISANATGDDDDKNSSSSKEKRPPSSQLQTRSRSGSGSQPGDLTTGSDSPGDEPAPAEVADGAGEDENKEYISGLALLAVMAGVTLTCFIMLLDMSIISTVSILSKELEFFTSRS